VCIPNHLANLDFVVSCTELQRFHLKVLIGFISGTCVQQYLMDGLCLVGLLRSQNFHIFYHFWSQSAKWSKCSSVLE
jgi:hypothetical protein